ncbi:MocR-like pyridoxine biosynthesis transcription factor PdxR [Phytoactinopolyspora halotolerans]|uniref:PLP-dependent aminotransferase family protein n=1 Tax=Phytoactinopolyspora halotolerans TaxID=1981512 RepID=A0A6L9SAP3_9ACTN|nr:PLP-dependent aminotransferase family protein [Phytoactinopolyspora halotolerans]NEE02113.1 PLP-dependent aminotransferase family protein [Phytoactinopolyspora halotolerans]
MENDWANSSAIGGIDLHLDLTPSEGKRAGLTRELRAAIRSGRLGPGTRLPPSRALAADLAMARNTVSEAYAELVAEGWLVARQGSGTRVAQRSAASAPSGSSLAPAAVPPRSPALPPSRPRYNLLQGSADAASFPRTDWLRSARRALSAAPNDAFGPGDPQGRVELRRALTDYLARARGVRVDPGRVVVCSGFGHALELLSGLLGDVVAVEEYGLQYHRGLLRSAGLDTPALPIDGGGARIEALRSTDARTVLLTPAHQFPTGGPLRPERRVALVDWAAEADGLILEDDYDGEFRYDRQPVGAVQCLDPERVVYLGTTSKSLSPAVRIGWLVVPERLVRPVVDVKGDRELRTSVLEQLTLADYLESGGYDRHVRRMRRRYRDRRDRLVAVLREYVPQVRVSGIAAGLHAVVDLPPDADEAQVVAEAERAGLTLDGLAGYRHPDSTASLRPAVVVGYGTPPEHAYPGALELLCRILRRSLGR